MVIETAAGEPLRMALVVGVAGSGKSTVGRLLAERLGWEYQDADAFHSEAGRARMALGRGPSTALRTTSAPPVPSAI